MEVLEARLFVVTLTCMLVLEASFAQVTLSVPSGFTTIQQAVDAARAGDIVEVAPGTYVENLVVDKSILIRGLGGEIEDDFGTISGAVPVLLGQVFGNGTPPIGIPSFPLHLDFPDLVVFHDGNAAPGPLIGAMPVSFGPVSVPTGLAGLTLRLQAFGLTAAANNANYAATHARDLEFR